jgi:hypothetical protein
VVRHLPSFEPKRKVISQNPLPGVNIACILSELAKKGGICLKRDNTSVFKQKTMLELTKESFNRDREGPIIKRHVWPNSHPSQLIFSVLLRPQEKKALGTCIGELFFGNMHVWGRDVFKSNSLLFERQNKRCGQASNGESSSCHKGNASLMAKQAI